MSTADDQGAPPAWEILYVGAHRHARHSGGLGEQDHRTWSAWLRRFGIDPDDVLLDPFFLVAEDDQRRIRYLGTVRDEAGRPLVRDGRIERCIVSVQLEAAAPLFPGERRSSR